MVKIHKLFLIAQGQSFLREGRVVGLCWANQNLKDLKHYQSTKVPCSPSYGRACRWAMLGEIET